MCQTQVGCAAITVPQVLVTSINSANGTGPVTLAYSITTKQLCTVADPTRIQVISPRYELVRGNGYSMRLWCSGDATTNMTVEWIDFLPQYNR